MAVISPNYGSQVQQSRSIGYQDIFCALGRASVKAFEGRRIMSGVLREPGRMLSLTAFVVLAGTAAAQNVRVDSARDNSVRDITTADDACRADAIRTEVAASSDRGLERITVTSRCRRGEAVRAVYDGSLQQQTFFSDEGEAHLAVALTGARAPITLSYQDGSTEEVPLARDSFENLSSVYRVTLQWNIAIDLNLHVVEPRGALNGKGDATAGHPPGPFGVRGEVDLADDGSGPGPFQESYVFTGQRGPTDVFSVYVENVPRGRIPADPYCGAGKFAEVALTFIIVDRGIITRKPVTLTPAACGRPLDDRGYYVKPHL
jgi:hypothetical protein